MARLFQSGFEANGLAGKEWNNSDLGSPTIVSDNFHGGSFALKIGSLVSATRMSMQYQFKAANSTGPIYARAYFKFTTFPSIEDRIWDMLSTDSNNRIRVTIDSTGFLRLYDEDGLIGTAAVALSTGTYYRLELLFDASTAAGSNTMTLKQDGTSIISASNRSVGTGIAIIRVGGNLGAELNTQGLWYIDDVAVNDSTGSAQTSYPGEGRVVFLRPNAAGDSNSFSTQVGGTAGSANNYTRVKEITPNSATDYNASAVVSEEDQFACDKTNIVSDVTISVVAVGAHIANLVAADAVSAIKLEMKKVTGGTKLQSSAIIPNSTTFQINAPAIPFTYPLITYLDPDGVTWQKNTLDTMQIGYIITAAGTRAIAVSAIWVSVDYATITPKRIFILSGSPLG